MRLMIKILVGLLGIYLLAWCGLALYFSFAERHHELLEANLEAFFKREVSIDEVRTEWRGLAPALQINGFTVAGDSEDIPALAFKSMSAELEPLSILRLWPKLTEFAVEAPFLEVVSLPDNRLQVAGLVLSRNRSSGISPKRLISWLMNHESVTWFDGEVVWRRLNRSLQRYSDLSFVYEREQQNRTLTAATQTDKGALAISAESNGNMLYDKNWDASLEVLGDQGQRLLSSDDLSLVVEKGQGRLQLRSLNVDRIRDFLQLTGISEAASWIMDAQLNGVLNNVQFDFAGPFLQFDEWSLAASASEINFLSTNAFPGMTHLAGSIYADRQGGTFKFNSDDSEFNWPKMFDQPFPIQQAEGQFRWSLVENGIIRVELEEAMFTDGVVSIESVDAYCTINTRYRRVGVLADWFTAGPIEDLRFEDGQIVSRSQDAGLYLKADAKFAIAAMEKTAKYLPIDPRVMKLREWWSNAFKSGVIPRAELSYEGPLSLGAVRDGAAQIRGRADFENVTLDYGYQREWPLLSRAQGVGTLSNDVLTITPTEAWVEDDQLQRGIVSISPIFDKGRVLNLKGSMQTSLETVADFLFEGPLLSPEVKAKQAEQPFPLNAEGGVVDADVEVTIPLKQVSQATVKGAAKVRDGRLELPGGVWLDDIATSMTFSESSATAKQITAKFLGGDVTAELITTEAAQPPKLRLAGTGRGDVSQLQPWVGEHLLSWFNGVTDWQGQVDIDAANVTIDAETDLVGVAVTAPAPLTKSAEQPSKLNFAMRTGAGDVKQELAMDYGPYLRVHMQGDLDRTNTLLDRSRIIITDQPDSRQPLLPPGVNFVLEQEQLNLDAWLEAIIDLATMETTPLQEGEVADTSFLDAMRQARIRSPSTLFLGRNFGPLNVSAATIDGHNWNGILNGENIDGTLTATPRADEPFYRLNLSRFHMVEAEGEPQPPEPIDASLRPQDYPTIELNANTFILAKKTLGRLQLKGAPAGDVWQITDFSLNNTDISTTGTGQWSNTAEQGSMSKLSFQTQIDEAGGVLDEMQFNDLIRQGEGLFKTNLSWIGAPHEFDFARLNGDFDLQINDGELVQVESGAGRLIGLLNFNSILRRLTLDFRDVFSSGLKFDRMQYTGIVAEGKAIMQEAFMLSPAVFVNMEGNIDLNNELIDMEIHASPELGGNLALLSAIANPTAGAVVFLTQRLFKDQMRSNSFLSYRADGTWEDFELIEIDDDGEPISQQREPQQTETIKEAQEKEAQPKGAGE